MSRVLTKATTSSPVSRSQALPKVSGPQKPQLPRIHVTDPSSVALITGLVLVVLACKVSGFDGSKPVHASGQALSQAPASSDTVFTAVLTSSKPASDGRPLLGFTTTDGYELTAYVSDDAQLSGLELGHSYVVRATVIQPGFVNINRVGAVTPSKGLSSARLQATNDDGVAYVQTATGTARVFTHRQGHDVGYVIPGSGFTREPGFTHE